MRWKKLYPLVLLVIEVALMLTSFYELWFGDFKEGILLMILAVVIGIERKADERSAQTDEVKS